jgi:hypothetical protein
MKKTTLFEKAFLEKLNPKKHDAGDYVKDFQKSKAPQFKGKSKKKKREMAIAAYLDAKEEDAQDIKVRKNKQGLMGSKTQVHKDRKKESSKKLGRKKVKEEDENTVGGGALGPTAAAGYGNTVSGTPGTDAYAPGDYRKPVALGAMYSRFGKVGKKRKTRKRKNKK